jgi:predicted TPR repeat methyltransferase
LDISLPQPDRSLSQDEEWCDVRIGDQWRRIRFHDYENLYAVPGLYEAVIYDILRCSSPATVCSMLAEAIGAAGERAGGLRVLDLGAGNGIVGAELVERGVDHVVGVDIIPEAARAAQRDRPDVYKDYLVADLSRLEAEDRRAMRLHRFNALTCVAALGFGDIPKEVFVEAYGLVQTGGWIAFNIKEDFLCDGDESGFAGLIRSMIRSGAMDVRSEKRYVHRLGTDQSPIHYMAIIGRKRRDIE